MRLLFSIVIGLLFSGCGIIKGSTNPTADSVIKTVEEFYPDDNVIEEGIEEMIKDTTTLDVDLSPDSPEK